MRADTKPDIDDLRQEILERHRVFIDAHVRNRPDDLVDDLTDEFINVSRGRLLRQTRDEIRGMFADYLGHTEFAEYRLLDEPTIGFSRDASVAWSIFRLKVAGTRTRDDGSAISFDTTWGCLVLYEHRDGRWLRIAEASNVEE